MPVVCIFRFDILSRRKPHDQNAIHCKCVRKLYISSRKPGSYPVIDVTVVVEIPMAKAIVLSRLVWKIRSVVTDVLDLSTRVTEGCLDVKLETSLINVLYI